MSEIKIEAALKLMLRSSIDSYHQSPQSTENPGDSQLISQVIQIVNQLKVNIVDIFWNLLTLTRQNLYKKNYLPDNQFCLVALRLGGVWELCDWKGQQRIV